MDFLIFIIVVAVIWYLNQQKKVTTKPSKAKHRSTRGGTRPRKIQKSVVQPPLASSRPSARTSPLRGIEITAKQRRLLGKDDPSVIAANLNSHSAAKTLFGAATIGSLPPSLDLFQDHSNSWFDRLFAGSPINVSSTHMTTDDLWEQPNLFDTQKINPATGLPMIGEFDVMGNAYGMDSSQFEHHDSLSSSSMDHFSNFDSHSSNGFNDW